MWSIVTETVRILNESAIYLLLGFGLAGVLHWLLRRGDRFAKLLSTRGSRSVLLASVLGLPLPLCSCSVLPAGLALRKNGASKGATASFLISVPETDIVSIMITYGLLGPVMAIFRPVAALITAVTTGLAANVVDRWVEAGAGSATGPDSCCSGDDTASYSHDRSAIWNILHYGFVKFFDDIIQPLLFGLVLGGVITALLPGLQLERLAGQSFVSMVVMLGIGIPMYVCATSSTPIAAGLIAAGVSPGAALVFLLAGPATNLAGLMVLAKHLGRPVLIVYLVSIAVVSLLMGLGLDALLASPAVTLPEITRVPMQGGVGPWKIGGAVVMAILTLLSLRRVNVFASMAGKFRRWTGLPFTARGVKIVAVVVAILAYLGSGFFVVGPGERGSITRFGRITHPNLSPGLHYYWPYPLGQADVISVTLIRRVELGFRGGESEGSVAAAAYRKRMMQGESWMLTGNEDIVDIKWVVQYRVIDSEAGLLAYLYGVEDPDRLVRDSAEAAIRAAVGRRNIDTLLTTERAAVEAEIADSLLQPALDRCASGIRVVTVDLLDVHAPPDVHWSFRDVASAAEEKMTTINTAMEYRERVVRAAEGEAARRTQAATGLATHLVELATGEGRAFREQWLAYQLDRAVTELRLYMETMDAVLGGLELYIQGSADPAGGLDLWLIRDEDASRVSELPQFEIGGTLRPAEGMR